jgi:hypothetical protein
LTTLLLKQPPQPILAQTPTTGIAPPRRTWRVCAVEQTSLRLQQRLRRATSTQAIGNRRKAQHRALHLPPVIAGALPAGPYDHPPMNLRTRSLTPATSAPRRLMQAAQFRLRPPTHRQRRPYPLRRVAPLPPHLPADAPRSLRLRQPAVEAAVPPAAAAARPLPAPNPQAPQRPKTARLPQAARTPNQAKAPALTPRQAQNPAAAPVVAGLLMRPRPWRRPTSRFPLRSNRLHPVRPVRCNR